MKLLLALTLSLALTGCGTFFQPAQKVDQQVVVKTKLVPITIPAEMFELPPYPAAVSPKMMTDKDLAVWLLDNEKFTQEVDKKLKAIKLYQEQRLKDLAPLLIP